MKGQYGTSTQLHGRKALREGIPGAPGKKAWPKLARQIEQANRIERAIEQAKKEQRAESTRMSRAKIVELAIPGATKGCDLPDDCGCGL